MNVSDADITIKTVLVRMFVSVSDYKDVLVCLRSLIATDCTAIVLGSSDSCGERGGGDPAGQLGSGSAHPGLRRAGDGAA